MLTRIGIASCWSIKVEYFIDIALKKDKNSAKQFLVFKANVNSECALYLLFKVAMVTQRLLYIYTFFVYINRSKTTAVQ